MESDIDNLQVEVDHLEKDEMMEVQSSLNATLDSVEKALEEDDDQQSSSHSPLDQQMHTPVVPPFYIRRNIVPPLTKNKDITNIAQPISSNNAQDNKLLMKIDALEDMVSLLLQYRHAINFLSRTSQNLPSEVTEDLHKCEERFKDALETRISNDAVFDFALDKLNDHNDNDQTYKRYRPTQKVHLANNLAQKQPFSLPEATTSEPAQIITALSARNFTIYPAKRKRGRPSKAEKLLREKMVKQTNPVVKKVERKSRTKKVDESPKATTTRSTRSSTGALPKQSTSSTSSSLKRLTEKKKTKKKKKVAKTTNAAVTTRSNTILKCPYRRCRFRSKSQASLDSHKEEAHKDMKFECTETLCGAKYDMLEELYEHLLEQHNISNFKCSICKKGFANLKSMREHKRTIHSGSKIDGTECPHCQRTFGTNRNLRRHVLLFHEEGVYSCPKDGCTFTAHFRNLVKMHETREHYVMTKCPYEGCDAEVNSLSLSLHLKRHYKIFTYRCSWPGCGKGFIDNKSMREHVCIHLNVKSWRCTWEGCDYASEQRTNCLKHVRIRHLKWPYTRKQEIEQNFVRDPNGPQPQHFIERIPEHPDILKLRGNTGPQKLDPAALAVALDIADDDTETDDDSMAPTNLLALEMSGEQDESNSEGERPMVNNFFESLQAASTSS